MSTEKRFGPSTTGETALAVVLALAAGTFLYFFWVIAPDFPRITKSAQYAILAATVCLVSAGAAWRWKRFQAEIVLSAKGVEVHATGDAPVPRTALPWKDLAALEHVVVARPRGGDLRYLVFVAGPGAASPGRRYSIISNGLDADLPVIVEAIAAMAPDHGFRLRGPRPGHVGSWLNGMNWALEPLGDTGSA